MTTNYEKIKNMTVDEMAEYISKTPNCGKCTLAELDLACHCECSKGIKQWLLEEYKDE
jgi:hypothetical protein